MKPRIIDRVLLSFLLLIFIAAMVALMLYAVGLLPAEGLISSAQMLVNGNTGFRIAAAAVSALLGIIAIKLLFTRSKPKERENGENASLLASDENGAAYITATSIDSMAQRYIKTNNRIRECVSKVSIHAEQGVSISLKAIVLADTNIPELCDKVRKELKEYIETYAGVKVSQIAFVVVNTYSPSTAARVS